MTPDLRRRTSIWGTPWPNWTCLEVVLFVFVKHLYVWRTRVCRWWPPWAGHGTPNTSCALTVRRRSAPETSLSAKASRTASRTTTTCSRHAATTATDPFWTCVPATRCLLSLAVSHSEDPATVTAVCVCVFRKWWRRWIGHGILSTSSVLSVDLFLDQKVTTSSHRQLLMCVNIPRLLKSCGQKLEWILHGTILRSYGPQRRAKILINTMKIFVFVLLCVNWVLLFVTPWRFSWEGR